MGEEEYTEPEVVHNPGEADQQVIDMTGDDDDVTDEMDLGVGKEPSKPPEGLELENKEPASEDEGKDVDEEGKEPESEDKGEEVKPQEFADVFSELKDDPSFRDITLDEGKKVLTEMVKDRNDFDETVKQFESDKTQILEMSDLMSENKELADHIWRSIDRHKKGLSILQTEEDLEREEELTPAQRDDREKIAALEKENKQRKLKEDTAFYQKKIDEVHSKFVDDDKKSLLSESDIDNIADIAIRNRTDDLVKVAGWYLGERQKHIDKAVEKALAGYKEKVKPEIIKEYMGLKEKERQEILDSGKKPLKAAPPERKKLSLDDDSAKKGFLKDLLSIK